MSRVGAWPFILKVACAACVRCWWRWQVLRCVGCRPAMVGCLPELHVLHVSLLSRPYGCICTMPWLGAVSAVQGQSSVALCSVLVPAARSQHWKAVHNILAAHSQAPQAHPPPNVTTPLPVPKHQLKQPSTRSRSCVTAAPYTAKHICKAQPLLCSGFGFQSDASDHHECVASGAVLLHRLAMQHQPLGKRGAVHAHGVQLAPLPALVNPVLLRGRHEEAGV
mmetsp:Transcript_25749/g.65477  ORF Transcript_25749/g.65477 Transcript_25749/m.65477 type:complete len:222 (+) Transcript_25749:268-933(+)